MYSVSADYLTALAQPFHKYKLTGSVGTESFDEANIIAGSLSITNRIAEGSEIKLGSVYTGELRATFTGLSIARGAWVGKAITLSEGLQLADDSFEYVPLGVFYISEANHTQEGVEVVAYDAMTKFDKSVSQTRIPTTGTAFAYLNAACTACGVTLGMASADLSTFPNGTATLNMFVDNGIETWRDLIGWVAQTLGSVSTINRAGELEVRQYSMTSAMSIDETRRFTGCQFSDFEARYTGMSAVNMVTRHTVYKSVTPDDGLTYNLGSNPLVQDDFNLVQNIIDDFSTVSLTPFTAQMLGGAIFDLCDCLTFAGGIAAGSVCGVMGYTWTYNGAYTVKGFGSNPALASAKSKTEKNLEGLYSTVAAEINEVSVVQNASVVGINENTETSILAYNFEVTQEENTTLIDVSVVMTSEATETELNDVYTLSDIVAQLKFYIDNVAIDVYDPEFIVDEGKDTMTFNYSLTGLTVGGHQFDIRLTTAGGSGRIEAGDVHEILWGYGITFEVYEKLIEVAQLPDRTKFYVGQRLNYNGIDVDLVYNNGLRNDVTSDCTFYPSEGTELSESDIGPLNVDVNYNDFSTEFALTVAEMAYEIIEGEYATRGYHKDIIPTILVMNSVIYAFGFYVNINNGPLELYITSMEMDANHKLTAITRATHSLSKTISGVTLYYRTGCRIGMYWYSYFTGNGGRCTAFRNSISSSYELNVSFVYLPDTSKTITASTFSSGRMLSVDGHIVFYNIGIYVNGSQVTALAYALLNGEDMTIYCYEAGTALFDYTPLTITAADMSNLAGGGPKLVYETKYLQTTSDGNVNIYQIHCDDNGVSLTLVDSIPSNAVPIWGYQVLESEVLIMKDTTNSICLIYNVETGEYKEFATDSSENRYKTFQYADKILWSEHYGCYFLPVDGIGNHYTLYRSYDLENWDLVEELPCADQHLGSLGNIASYGNDLISTWWQEEEESGTVYSVYNGITLDFAD